MKEDKIHTQDADSATEDTLRESSQPETGQKQQAQSAAAMPSAEELDSLRKQARERDEYLELAKRTRADFDNYQKRVAKDREAERRYGAGEIMRDMLPVLDNLERAIAAAKQGGEAGALVDGVAMVQSQFLESLKRHGVTRIVAEGADFDPNLHQAIMQQPSAEVPANTVLQVVEQGYMIHDRVLRPSKVIVSTQPSS